MPTPQSSILRTLFTADSAFRRAQTAAITPVPVSSRTQLSAAVTSVPAEAPESRGFADRPCILGSREQQQTPRAATRRGALPARGSAPQPEASPLAAQLTSSSLTQVEGRTLLQMTLPAKGELCAAPNRDRRVSVSPKRAPAGGGVSFTRTLPPELELPSAGVVESGMSESGVDTGGAQCGDRRRGLIGLHRSPPRRSHAGSFWLRPKHQQTADGCDAWTGFWGRIFRSNSEGGSEERACTALLGDIWSLSRLDSPQLYNSTNKTFLTTRTALRRRPSA